MSKDANVVVRGIGGVEKIEQCDLSSEMNFIHCDLLKPCEA